MHPVIQFLPGESMRTADTLFTIQGRQPALAFLGQPLLPLTGDGDHLNTQGGRERLPSHQHAGDLTPDRPTPCHSATPRQVSGGVL